MKILILCFLGSLFSVLSTNAQKLSIELKASKRDELKIFYKTDKNPENYQFNGNQAIAKIITPSKDYSKEEFDFDNLEITGLRIDFGRVGANTFFVKNIEINIGDLTFSWNQNDISHFFLPNRNMQLTLEENDLKIFTIPIKNYFDPNMVLDENGKKLLKYAFHKQNYVVTTFNLNLHASDQKKGYLQYIPENLYDQKVFTGENKVPIIFSKFNQDPVRIYTREPITIFMVSFEDLNLNDTISVKGIGFRDEHHDIYFDDTDINRKFIISPEFTFDKDKLVKTSFRDSTNYPFIRYDFDMEVEKRKRESFYFSIGGTDIFIPWMFFYILISVFPLATLNLYILRYKRRPN